MEVHVCIYIHIHTYLFCFVYITALFCTVLYMPWDLGGSSFDCVCHSVVLLKFCFYIEYFAVGFNSVLILLHFSDMLSLV